MKMMHGAFARACSNRSRTRAAPTPTNISTNSLPLMEKNGTSASPATARASSVLPVPGGPTSSTPLGIRPPRREYCSGFFRNSTTSASSALASSTPATSEKRVLMSVSTKTLALLLPMARSPPPPPPIRPAIRRISTAQMPKKSTVGATQPRSAANQGFSTCPANFTPAFSRALAMSLSTLRVAKWVFLPSMGSFSVPLIWFSPTVTSATFSSSSSFWNWL